MNGFFSSVPPARDWFYGVRTFAASMIALYIAMLMQMPRPYWAMATVYIVSSPFLGPTSSKALYRAIGTFLGAAAAVLFVPMFVQSPYVLVLVIVWVVVPFAVGYLMKKIFVDWTKICKPEYFISPAR